MKNPRYSTGPTSPRGQAAAARKKMEHAEKYAPGLSLDMSEEFEVPQDVLRSLGKPKKQPESKKMSKGGMPDLTGDGKVTRADVLKGRGVFKHGGAVKSSASKRADGIAQRGKTRGKMI